MRPEGIKSLDLNNLPEDYYTRDGSKQASGDSSSSVGGYRKKKSGEKDEAAKVYECRFCSLKFCKSQALGGHMNRHRQERETETLNKARQLVFSNDLAPAHLGYVSSGQPISHGGYHQASNNMDDTSLPFRSVYPSRVFSTSPLVPPLPQPPPPQTASYIYPSPPQLLSIPSQYPAAPPANDYYVGHVISNPCYGASPNGSYCTCIGTTVGHHGSANSGSSSGGGGGGGGGDLSRHNDQEEGLNWGRR